MKTNTELRAKFDENGNLVYKKDKEGTEWHEYDDKENLIHSKYLTRSNDTDEYQEYEYWYEYDENNNKTHFQDSENNESWWLYDEYNNCIHYNDSMGVEIFRDYNEYNKCIYCKLINFDDTIEEDWFEYDSNLNLTHYKNKKEGDIHEEWREYDYQGNCIHFKNNNGEEVKQEFDSCQNRINYIANNKTIKVLDREDIVNLNIEIFVIY